MQRSTRNSGIELLRILAIMGVVILHFNNADIGGGFRHVAEGSINQYYLYFSECVSVCAVNLFVIISAYFLCMSKKRRLIKVIELILQVIAFRAAFYLLSVARGGGFQLKSLLGCFLPVNYFVILYSVVYILSPYCNVLIDKLSIADLKKMVITMVVLLSVWSYGVDLLMMVAGPGVESMSTVGAYGSQYGYTVVNFFLIYFIGAYIRKAEIDMKSGKAFLLFLLTTLALFAMSILEYKMDADDIRAWYYNSPLVILAAVSLLLLFKNFTFSSRIINELAGAAFTCFLIHTHFLRFAHIEYAVNAPLYILISIQLAVALLSFLVSYIVYKIYGLLTGWFIRLITPAADKVNLSVEG